MHPIKRVLPYVYVETPLPKALPLLTLLAGLIFASCEGFPAPTEIPAVPIPPTLPVIVAKLQESVPQVPSSTSTRLPVSPTATLTHPLARPSATFTRLPERPTATRTALPLTSTPVPTLTPSHDLAALDEYQRGVAYVAVQNGAYSSTESDKSLDLLFATGANYLSLLVTWYQNDSHSTDIQPTVLSPSDEDLAHVIAYAHSHGVRVLLKPQIELVNDPDHWRGEISFADDATWQSWFTSYLQFISHYAQFAQVNGVEEFSIGTELVTASKRTQQWRGIIRAVRAQYTGLLTYSALHSGEEVSVEFWDDLDFIGVNSFYHLTNFRSPTINQLIDGWRWPVLQLERLHARFPDKPIIFTEVGYPSIERANVWPWNWYRLAPVDLDGQARCYEALFRVWWKNPNLPWFHGLFMWNWLASPQQGGPQNTDYTPYGKPAESVLNAWFADSPQSSPYALIQAQTIQQ
jgi:hypothetical protein